MVERLQVVYICTRSQLFGGRIGYFSSAIAFLGVIRKTIRRHRRRCRQRRRCLPSTTTTSLIGLHSSEHSAGEIWYRCPPPTRPIYAVISDAVFLIFRPTERYRTIRYFRIPINIINYLYDVCFRLQIRLPRFWRNVIQCLIVLFVRVWIFFLITPLATLEPFRSNIFAYSFFWKNSFHSVFRAKQYYAHCV